MTAQRFCILLFAIAGFAPPIFAASYSSVVVYGDSLSDNGNLYSVSGYPPSPYYQGRKSNGPVAVEQVATAMNKPLADNAWIGATTGVGNLVDGGTVTATGAFSLPGMTASYDLTKAGIGGAQAAGSLFIVWGGPNDLLAPSALDNGNPAAIIARAVADEVAIITDMKLNRGVNTILAPGMPDLGLTPTYRAQGALVAAQATAFTNAFNALLVASLPAGVLYFDTAALMRQVVANPSAYGFANVTGACYDGTTVCANPNSYLFFDDFHPTQAANALIARGFLAAAEVPEPPTPALAGMGLALLLAWRRPSRAAAALARGRRP